MAVNSIGDFIRSVFSKKINKDGAFFKALLADKEQKNGTIEKIFYDLEETRKSWQDLKSVYDVRGEMFDKTIKVFSVLEMQQSDSEETYLNRLRLLFERNGRDLWGTRFDILDIFKMLSNNENMYIVNNTDTKNLLQNGNFEQQTSWTLTDCSYEKFARFEETTGIFFNSIGFLSQSASVDAQSTYFLHFFLKGKIRVKITDNNGRFWNQKSGEMGAWQNQEHYESFSSTEWQNKSTFFFTDETVSSVTVEFAYIAGETAFLDYVRLNEKSGTSTFSLIAVFEGKGTAKTAHFAPGNADPIIAPADWGAFGYYAKGNADTKAIPESASSFIEKDAFIEDKSPILQERTSDIEPLDGYENMSYNDETKAFSASPLGTDDFQSIDYTKISYFDNTFVFGATANAADIFQEILDIVSAAGIVGTVEILSKESD